MTEAPQIDLTSALRERILVLDGAMGSMIQTHKLDEAAFRGDSHKGHGRSLKGCNDLLVLTQPHIIEDIHLAFLEAGADIIETNTFSATSIALEDYGLEGQVESLNRAAVEVAKRARKRFHASRDAAGLPAKPVWIAVRWTPPLP